VPISNNVNGYVDNRDLSHGDPLHIQARLHDAR
jgi:hypothetical protein